MERLYTINETANLMRISRMQLYRLRVRKKIKFFRQGKSVVFSEKHIQDYLDSIETKYAAPKRKKKPFLKLDKPLYVLIPFAPDVKIKLKSSPFSL